MNDFEIELNPPRTSLNIIVTFFGEDEVTDISCRLDNYEQDDFDPAGLIIDASPFGVLEPNYMLLSDWIRLKCEDEFDNWLADQKDDGLGEIEYVRQHSLTGRQMGV